MVEEDITKTSFRCPGAISLFEWVVMTFGLKNVGSTYQRAMNYIFHKLIGRIVEIYIDDVMIKFKGYKEHLADLRETLEYTRKHGLKINPNKCAFGILAGQFLGFMVHETGIKVGQKSIKAIDEAIPRLLRQSCNLCLVRLISSEDSFQICQKGSCRFLPW